jgi:hypothetical protein
MASTHQEWQTALQRRLTGDLMMTLFDGLHCTSGAVLLVLGVPFPASGHTVHCRTLLGASACRHWYGVCLMAGIVAPLV